MRPIRAVEGAVAILGATVLVVGAGRCPSARAGEEAAGSAQTSLEQTPASPGPSAPEPVAASADRRILGLMLHIGQLVGFGGGVQAGSRDVGLRASAGWVPLLLAVTNPNQTVDLKFHGAFMVAPDAYLRLATVRETTHIGTQAGYRYNSLLGHGLAAGGYVEFALGKMEGLVSGGLMVFPDGESRVRREEGAPGLRFSFPGPGVVFGASLGLVIFP
jgi:hypothetical protein